MAVAQGAAVGGGSHIYANISVEATPATFESGWPPEVTYQELAPHYSAVARDDERPAGPARPVAGTDGADARGGDEDRLRATVSGRWTWRSTSIRAGTPRRPMPATRPVAPLHQCRGDRAGDVHPPRGVRHRLPGPRPQHPRHELHPARRAARRRGPPAPHRAVDRDAPATATASSADRIEDRRLVPRDRGGADRGRGRRLARLHGAPAPLPRRRADAPRPAAVDRPGLEQQRRLPDDRPAQGSPRRSDPRPDDHQRHRLPRRFDRRPLVHHRGRRVPRRRRALDVAAPRPAGAGCAANGSCTAGSRRRSRSRPRSSR